MPHHRHNTRLAAGRRTRFNAEGFAPSLLPSGIGRTPVCCYATILAHAAGRSTYRLPATRHQCRCRAAAFSRGVEESFLLPAPAAAPPLLTHSIAAFYTPRYTAAFLRIPFTYHTPLFLSCSSPANTGRLGTPYHSIAFAPYITVVVPL